GSRRRTPGSSSRSAPHLRPPYSLEPSELRRTPAFATRRDAVVPRILPRCLRRQAAGHRQGLQDGHALLLPRYEAPKPRHIADDIDQLSARDGDYIVGNRMLLWG